ncbi:MAG: 4-(cytidine 5'-diphospho)-2-C-methyl-D-erythritol kinase [Actinomycetaceae bacterium]|nr:4-(cytidine 5'-diphospho)-2-C-methyl-D-erythritol kinase [Actinomycetaceae bacterium]
MSATLARVVTADAPGKVNLILRVTGLDAQTGYHELLTVFHCLNLREVVRLSVRADEKVTVQTVPGPSFAGALPSGLDGPDNLAVRAVQSLRHYAQDQGKDAPGIDIHITKNIPVAGGMAGGSADACAALVAANELLGLNMNREELARFGVSIGADVPYGLWGEQSLGVGFGNDIRPLDAGPTRHWVFLSSSRGLSTPVVFGEYDRLELHNGFNEQRRSLEDKVLGALRGDNPILEVIENDLQAPALRLRPELEDVIAAAKEAGAVSAFVSGSGPTIAALCESEAAAKDLAATVASHPEVCEAIVATGPSGPARILAVDNEAPSERERT